MIGWLALLACVQQGLQVESPQGPRDFTLIYTNNLDGEIEPCG